MAGKNQKKQKRRRSPSHDLARAEKNQSETLRRRELTISNVVRYLFNVAVLLGVLWFAAEVIESVYGCRDHRWLVENAQQWEWWKEILSWVLRNWGAEWIPVGLITLVRISFGANKKEYLASRNRFLEEERDPHRDSSRVQRNGGTNKGDL